MINNCGNFVGLYEVGKLYGKANGESLSGADANNCIMNYKPICSKNDQMYANVCAVRSTYWPKSDKPMVGITSYCNFKLNHDFLCRVE